MLPDSILLDNYLNRGYGADLILALLHSISTGAGHRWLQWLLHPEHHQSSRSMGSELMLLSHITSNVQFLNLQSTMH
jgi:hypothetical protein